MKKIFICLLVLLFSKLVYANSTDVFSFSRTSCFGRCPVFDMNVFSDGVIVFEGIEHTDKKGIFRLSKDQSVFTRIQKILDDNDFSEFLDSYDYDWIGEGKESPCEEVMTDLPGSIFTMQYVNTRKRVDYYHGCRGFQHEEQLKQLEKSLFEIIDELTYAKFIDVFSYSTASCVVGSCSTFKINIFSDGVVILKKGISNEKEEVFRLPKEPELFIQIRKLLKENRFSKFHDRYDWIEASKGGACKEVQSDHPSSTFTMQRRRSKKTVYYYHGCKGFKREKQLIQLEKSLFEIMGLEKYIGT